MRIGQIVERRNLSLGRKAAFRTMMRKAMKDGMTFSVAEEGDVFAIRRDK